MPKSLTEADLAGYKTKLLDLRARLRGDVSAMADVALNKDRMEGAGDSSAMPIHMADVGTDNYEQEFTLSIAQTGSAVLSQIDDAIKRIEDGTYGECEDCEKSISKARLNAIPYASRCIKCASELEQNL
ncbi:MAG: TraR/DksA family transcriptional regulator [Planctomycetaceae bacterium]|nr:TraR/DksA family transcriptional regulator [Planctomycetaceae bacterium]